VDSDLGIGEDIVGERVVGKDNIAIGMFSERE